MHATTILSLALALVPFSSARTAEARATVTLFSEPNFQGQNVDIPMHRCVDVQHMDRVGSMNIQPFDEALCTLYADMGCRNAPLCRSTQSVSDLIQGDENCRANVGDQMQTIFCRTFSEQ